MNRPFQDPKYTIDDDCRLRNSSSGTLVPSDEPIFILRAQDKHAIAALEFYKSLCEDENHKGVVGDRIDQFIHFMVQHPDRLKEPDS